MTQPTREELRDIASALMKIADENERATNPENTAAYYARCIIHAAALNLRTAAGDSHGHTDVPAFVTGRAMNTSVPMGAGMDLIPTVHRILRSIVLS